MGKGVLATRKGSHGSRSGSPCFEWFAKLAPGAALDAAGDLEFRALAPEGEWGCVLQVLHKPSGGVRALKVIRPELMAKDELRRAFEEGLEKAALVEGSVAVKIYDMGRIEPPSAEKGAPLLHFAMEWFEGKSLRELLGGGGGRRLSFGGLTDKAAGGSGASGGGLLPEQAFQFIEQAALGVGELHRAGVLHLDLKPEHIVAGRKNQVRLIGFGLPIELRRAGDERLGINWRTSRYAPPELLRGEWERLGPHCDLYQLGVVLYELLTGRPCSPWLGYEEICENVDFVPAALDDLIQDCIGEREERPRDIDHFLGMLATVVEQYRENERKNRAKPERRAKEMWGRAQALAGLKRPRWGQVVGLCQKLLEEKPHLLPFGKIPVKAVQELLAEAQGRLQKRRRVLFEQLLDDSEWRSAKGFIAQLGGEVPAAELGDVSLTLELAQLAEPHRHAEGGAEAYRRIVELLKEPNLGAEVRERAGKTLEKLVFDAPSQAAAEAVPVVTDLGVLAPLERFRVETDQGVASWWVVVGPSLRIGRGSLEEFGNHIDLRPTKREAAESSITIALAQQVSRAGHLELRLGADGLEAFCMGTQGATVDDRQLKRGERTPLRDSGRCVVAHGASELTYRVVRDDRHTPIAVALEFVAGVGLGRRAVWVLGGIPLQLLYPGEAEGMLVPTPDGWRIEAASGNLVLSGNKVGRGARTLWPQEGLLEIPPKGRISRGHSVESRDVGQPQT
jgi:hypothetical protein